MTSPQQPPPGQNPWQQYPPPQQYAAPQGGPPPAGPPPYGYQQPGQAPQGYLQQPAYGPPQGNPYGAQYNAVQQFPKPTGWFVVNWLFFWPLAIYSLTSAWGNIDRALFAGDLAGAQFQANRVKKFGIIALCIGAGWILLWIIIAASVASSTCSTYSC